MKLFLRIFSTLCILFNHVYAQDTESIYSSSDPLYWKNRKPYSGYWQQDVYYKIDAKIDESVHVIFAKQELQYWNNSPDTLDHVFFHLFQNAFVKGSYIHELYKANKVRTSPGNYESLGLGTIVENIKVDGEAAVTELDNTILKVKLPKPLLPGSKVTFSMDFETFYDRGSIRRRMQMYDAWGFMHYNGCQWFPKICVYDAKFGWDTHQHLGKEFYGNFGRYDVTLDFASNYIVEATGVLQNRQEVLPDELRRKLDIKNFVHKKWEEPPSIIIPYEKDVRKKWHFIADHVHDFAFTADPSYRIGTEYWNGIECVGLVQEPHASGWQNAASIVAKTIQFFSENYGQYHYPKMIAADARDGMEYPMLTLDGGKDPDYRGLLVHEMGHNWYYGMVGSNETYRAALDEGFTQFLTAEGLIHIDGEWTVESPSKSKWVNRFKEPILSKDIRVYNAYIADAATGNDHALNTHSDEFGSALGHGGGYRLVYYKTATMLYNLQYTIGDSLFAEAMRHYFDQWKFAHPYFEDFRNSIIRFTKIDLNWFFDQWLETDKGIDYSIKKVKKIKNTDSFAVTFRRLGEMQMPIDFSIKTKKGDQLQYYIPNNWYEKATNATVLPRWIGWGKLNKDYTAIVKVADGIKSVRIDETNRLADHYMLNNYRKRGLRIYDKRIVTRFDAGFHQRPDWKNYRMYVRPDIWYNGIDGIKAGIHFEGGYLNNFSLIDGAVWFNSTAGRWQQYRSENATGIYANYAPVNYSVNLGSLLSPRMPHLSVFLNSRFLDGLIFNRVGGNYKVDQNNQLSMWIQSMQRNRSNTDYLLYPNEWSSASGKANTALQLQWLNQYKYAKGNGSILLSARGPLFSDHFNYNYAQLEVKNYHVIHRLLLSARLFARVGNGDRIPYESALYQAGANPEEMMENKYLRSNSFVPQEWLGYSQYTTNHFHYGGGLNMRGYAGYYMFDFRNNEPYVGYKGRSGASINAELDFTDYLKWQPPFTRQWLKASVYLFADAGIIELSSYDTLNNQYWNTIPSDQLSDFRFDAGIGVAFTIKKWGVFNKAKPLTLRFDMPVFINRTPFGDPQHMGARWLVGINRAF